MAREEGRTDCVSIKVNPPVYCRVKNAAVMNKNRLVRRRIGQVSVLPDWISFQAQAGNPCCSALEPGLPDWAGNLVQSGNTVWCQSPPARIGARTAASLADSTRRYTNKGNKGSFSAQITSVHPAYQYPLGWIQNIMYTNEPLLSVICSRQ